MLSQLLTAQRLRACSNRQSHRQNDQAQAQDRGSEQPKPAQAAKRRKGKSED
jgi:hypothetical protein